MKKFKCKVYNIKATPHDVDDDIINFEFDVDVSEPEKFSFSYFYPFDKLMGYIEKSNPRFYKYIESTRDNLDLWGPAETQTVNALGEEEISQLHTALMECVEKFIYKDLAFYKRLTRTDHQQRDRYKQKLEKFSEMEKEIKQSANKSRRFCQQVERAIRDTAVNIYPEIAELPAEKLLKFKHLFVNEILQMDNKIEKLLT